MSGPGPVEDFARLRPVVLGSDGRAGSAIARELSKVAPHTVAATRIEMDITDYFGLRWELDRLQADLVINAAAWSDPERCEDDVLGAFQVNGQGAGDAARAATAAGAHFVHLSSVHIFDGLKGSPYTEKDAPAPRSAHGRSKLAGEMKVVEAAPEALIVRTAWLFGGAGKYPDPVERVLAAAASPESIAADSTRRGSPTLVDDLACELLLLIGLGAHGIVHLSGGGAATELEFARQVMVSAALDPDRVEDSPPGGAGSKVLWPADARLDTSRHRQFTGSQPRHWKEALAALMAARRAPGEATAAPDQARQEKFPDHGEGGGADPPTGRYGPH